MTAHISYAKIDKNNPATFSKKIIKKVIRKSLKFKGILYPKIPDSPNSIKESPQKFV